MEEREFLKSDVIDRVANFTNDTRTFLWMRYCHYNEIQDQSLRIGGGNFLIALANFSALDYLAKIYFGLKNNPSNWHKKRTKDPFNASECFLFLIRSKHFPVRLGFEKLQDNEIKNLWDEWRNCLTHFLVQKENNSSISYITHPNEGEDQYKKFIKQEPKTINPFSAKPPGNFGWDCYVDELSPIIDRIASFVASEVDKAEETNIRAVNDWIRANIRE